MLKTKTRSENGFDLYGFGLSSENIRRLKDGNPIFFDFAEVDTPGYYGFIFYLEKVSSKAINQYIKAILKYEPNTPRGCLRHFIITPYILSQFAQGKAVKMNVRIANKDDRQLFFHGETESSMTELIREFIHPTKTMKSYRGFGS